MYLTQPKKTILRTWPLLILLLSTAAHAEVDLPDNPTESILYWNDYVVQPESNTSVTLTKQVFNQLLQSWDGGSIKPKLNVVDSLPDPWAASLADGNILINLRAVQLALESGPERGRELLAFILAHELAHQRNNDLWHLKFLRLAASLEAVSHKIKLTLPNSSEFIDKQIIEQKETHADSDALAMMAVAGFDPISVIDGTDFFTIWAETTLGRKCNINNLTSETPADCVKAKNRADNAKANIISQANQSFLFTLGKQFFIAGQYASAREFFQVFGKKYPFQAVINNIGLSYIAQALQIDQYLRENITSTEPWPVFPLMLQSLKQIPNINHTTHFRSAAKNSGSQLSINQIRKMQQDKQTLVEKGIKVFEEAKDKNENKSQIYRFIMAANLIIGNHRTAEGYLHDKYAKIFAEELSLPLWIDYFTAQINLVDGDMALAKTQFLKLRNHLESTDKSNQPANLLDLVYQNYVAILKSQNSTSELNEFFQPRINKFNPSKLHALLSIAPEFTESNHMTVNSSKLSNHWEYMSSLHQQANLRAIVLLSGDPLRLYEVENNLRLMKDKKSNVVAYWETSSQSPSEFLTILNQKFKDNKLGQATRIIPHLNGYYLAFDQHGLAINVESDQVKDWFRYPNISNTNKLTTQMAAND